MDQLHAVTSARFSVGTVGAGATREVVERILKMNVGRFRACHEEALKGGHEGSGTLEMAFTLGGDGSVLRPRVSKNTVPLESLEGCALDHLSHLFFPAPQRADVPVTLRLDFATKAAEPFAPERAKIETCGGGTLRVLRASSGTDESIALSTLRKCCACSALKPSSAPSSLTLEADLDAEGNAIEARVVEAEGVDEPVVNCCSRALRNAGFLAHRATCTTSVKISATFSAH